MAQPTYTKVGSRAGHRSYVKTFLSLMSDIQRREGWREEQTFTHWLTTACSALANPALRLNGDMAHWERNEKRYMDVVRLCHHPQETMADFTSGLSVIIEALEADPTDVLSPIFTEVAASAGWGQFFTPWDVSRVIADLTLSHAPELLERVWREQGRNYIDCLEPACGVGGMMLAANQAFRSQGIDTARQVHWVGVDVDFRAICGAYIQMTLTGASAILVHGNSLTLEEHESLPTICAVLHPKLRRSYAREVIEGAAPTEEVPTPAPAARPQPDYIPKQLGLFS